ncbi:MAG: helix-turn-helix transcriptional regulator [Lachnospiraceae bacterium]|nr:helix-turn-helix transcriptional regulator [Lachnospiraceae bacterium]
MAEAQKELQKIRSKDDLYPFMSAKTDEIMKHLSDLLNNRQLILVTQARNYIKMNYSNCDLSIHEVSESLGISDPYLSSIFTEYTGESPLTFLNSYRIEIAKQLLAESKMIIKDIGFNTGFNTVQNFNRVFKRYTGMTPGEYRKMNQ